MTKFSKQMVDEVNANTTDVSDKLEIFRKSSSFKKLEVENNDTLNTESESQKNETGKWIKSCKQ